MDIRKINDELSVSTQISVDDISKIKSEGYKAIICNRPDGEEPDQPVADSLAKAAEKEGLDFVYMPVKMPNDPQSTEFFNTVKGLPHPVLAFCRTGTRSAMLWARSNMGLLGRDNVLDQVRSAGYDLSDALPPQNSALSTGEDPLAAKATVAKVTSKTASTAKATQKKTTAATKAAVKKTAAKTTAKTAKTTATKSAAKKTSSKAKPKSAPKPEHYSIVIIGGGASGIAVAASLKNRKSDLDICIVEPSDKHYYQPGWTMVGGGIFKADSTERDEKDQIPAGVKWIQKSATSFDPKKNSVKLDDKSVVTYDRLILAPGLQLNWGAVKGLEENLGKNGVTSNYRFDLAPYTWKLVQNMKSGKAIFTQPPMPIKCAGAPQKAMYLSCSEWKTRGVLKDIQVDFCNAGGVLFGVPDYVPALMEYVDEYKANLDFFHNLVEVDGKNKVATFEVSEPDQKPKKVKMEFDMIHVCPPQSAPDFIKSSPFSSDAGWVAVDPQTLQSTKFDNVWALGDVVDAPNAKTAAAARKQAPVVADNIIADINGKPPVAGYDGYGSCPLTVERGKIVLAEFGYGGKLLPSFPKWIINGKKPSTLAWQLKAKVLPGLYWNSMLKGKEWLAKPEDLNEASTKS